MRGQGLSLLHVSPTHHYFTNDTGQAVFLNGKHSWPLLVNNNYYGSNDDASDYDNYTNYIADLVANHQNLTTLWSSDVVWDQFGDPPTISGVHSPLPFNRSGPCCALDGGNKFDLTDYNSDYFDRLSNIVAYANARNVYCIVRLFDGWRLTQGAAYDYWDQSVFNAANNSSGMLVNMTNLFRLNFEENEFTNILAAYVRHTVDALSTSSNVLWEVCLEAPSYSTNFQRFIIETIRSYEGSGGRLRHPVGLSALNDGVVPSETSADHWDENLWTTNGIPSIQVPDYISPSAVGPSRLYTNSPPPLCGGSYPLVILDTDHLNWTDYGGDTPSQTMNGVRFVWKAFTRGYSVHYMDGNQNKLWPLALNSEMQRAMADAATYAARMDLLTTGAATNIASTGFCLTNASELLVYSPDNSGFQVLLPVGSYSAEWFSPEIHAVNSTALIQSSGGFQDFEPPAGLSSAVLYLRASERAEPGLTIASNTYRPGEAILVNITNALGSAADWVGLFAVGTPSTAYLQWTFTDGTQTGTPGLANGSVQFQSSVLLPGDYEARLFFDGDYHPQASVGFSVQDAIPVPPPATINSKSSYLLNETIGIDFFNAPGNAADWIGLFSVATPNAAYLLWSFTDGTLAGTSGQVNGTVHFEGGLLPPGDYEARLFFNGDYIPQASVSFTVQDSGPAATTTKSSYSVGEAIGVNFVNAEGNASDWVGLFSTRSPDTAYLQWVFSDGTQVGTPGLVNGSVTFQNGLPNPGNYEVRLFFRGDYNPKAVVPFQVQLPDSTVPVPGD